MSQRNPPKSVRIRTKGENAYRFDAIQTAADFYGENKSDAVAHACDDVVRLARAIEDVLELVDSVQEREEIAERLDRAASFDIDVEHDIEIGGDR